MANKNEGQDIDTLQAQQESLRQKALEKLEQEKIRKEQEERRDEKRRVRYESGLTKEELIRYRQGGKEDGIEEKIRFSRRIFSDVEIVSLLIAYFVINMALFYFIGGNLIVSAFVGLVGTVYFFLVFAYEDRKLTLYQEDLSGLLNYVMNMSFFLASGENVLQALESTKEMSSERIQEDIQKTIDVLKERTEIETDHFYKYNYQSLNQFHHTLKIYYENGGDAKIMFEEVKDTMSFEIKKRDELWRKRKGYAFGVYVLIGMVFLVLVVLRTMVSSLWAIFLSYTIVSQVMLLMTYFSVLGTLYILQRQKVDISIKY